MKIEEKKLLKPINNLLVIRNGGLGDFILTLPVIKSLKKGFPSARIVVMGNSATLTLAQGYVDGIISNDMPGLHTLYHHRGNIPENVKQALGCFDLVVSYSSDPYGAFMQNLKKIGVPWIINGVFSPMEKFRTPAIDLLLLPLRKAGIPFSLEPPRIIPSFLDREFARKFFQSSLNSGERLRLIVAIHPGSGSPKKCWPIEKFVRLAMWVKKNFSTTIVLISGPADKHITEEIMPLIKSCHPILANQLPLTHLAGILERCNVYVGNDSGVTHLAAAVGIPTLALFGPTDFRIWGPRNEKVKWLHGIYPCAPCSPQQMAQCSNPACMDSLPVATVKKGFLSLFARFCCTFLNNKIDGSFKRKSYHV